MINYWGYDDVCTSMLSRGQRHNLIRTWQESVVTILALTRRTGKNNDTPVTIAGLSRNLNHRHSEEEDASPTTLRRSI
jgi:hypothetical protein